MHVTVKRETMSRFQVSSQMQFGNEDWGQQFGNEDNK